MSRIIDLRYQRLCFRRDQLAAGGKVLTAKGYAKPGSAKEMLHRSRSMRRLERRRSAACATSQCICHRRTWPLAAYGAVGERQRVLLLRSLRVVLFIHRSQCRRALRCSRCLRGSTGSATTRGEDAGGATNGDGETVRVRMWPGRPRLPPRRRLKTPRLRSCLPRSCRPLGVLWWSPHHTR